MSKTLLTATALIALALPAYALNTFDGTYSGTRTVQHKSRTCVAGDVSWKVVDGFVGDNVAVAAEVAANGTFKGTGTLHQGNNYIAVNFSGQIIGTTLVASIDRRDCHEHVNLTKQH